MKTLLFVALLLAPLGMRAQGNRDYRSSRVHYYVPYWKSVTPVGAIDFETAYWKGANVWVLMELDSGGVIFEQRPWGNFQYGIIPGTNETGQLDRQQAIRKLNSWIDAYYSLAEQDRKYNQLGYSFPYYAKIANSKLEACPAFDDYEGDTVGVKAGDVGTKYSHSGRYTDGVGMSLWIPGDYRCAIFYPSDELPCVENNRANYEVLVELDVEYYLPGYLTFAGIPMDGSLSNMVQCLRKEGFVELEADGIDEILDEEMGAQFFGVAENRVMMKGNFYGAPCIIWIFANPESKKVYTIQGSYNTTYLTLSQAQQTLDKLIDKLSNDYGAGEYSVTDTVEKEYCIQNQYGQIFLKIKKMGIGLENEGEYAIEFNFTNK